MKRLLFIAALLSGCTTSPSTDNAGLSTYDIEPIVNQDGSKTCCKVHVINGKQYASVNASMTQGKDGPTIKFKATGVEAFQGQQIAADVAAANAAMWAQILPQLLQVVGSATGRPIPMIVAPVQPPLVAPE